MNQKVVTIVLIVGLLFSLAALALQAGAWHLPGNQQGYEPVQPVAFSHRLHAGEMQIACLYCHSGAEASRHAGIPPASTCMNCHKFVSAPLGALRAEDELAKKEKRAPQRIVSPEIQKVYDALALGADLKPDPSRQPAPIQWLKVHNLPDFVYFNHAIHIQKGIGCVSCHGRVDKMPIMWKEEPLTMEWCLECHRHPERHLREKREVFNMEWAPPVREQLEIGRDLIEREHIEVDRLTNCSVCHR